MQFSIVLLKYARASLKNMPGWEQMLLYNMYTPFSTDSVFSDVQVASSLCTNSPPYHQICRYLDWTMYSLYILIMYYYLLYEQCTQMCLLVFVSMEVTASMISKRNSKFHLSYHREDFASIHLKFFLAQRYIWSVFTNHDFLKCSRAYTVIFMMKSYLFLMQSCLRTRRSGASKMDFQPSPLCTEISNLGARFSGPFDYVMYCRRWRN